MSQYTPVTFQAVFPSVTVKVPVSQSVGASWVKHTFECGGTFTSRDWENVHEWVHACSYLAVTVNTTSFSTPPVTSTPTLSDSPTSSMASIVVLMSKSPGWACTCSWPHLSRTAGARPSAPASVGAQVIDRSGRVEQIHV